MVHSTIPLLHNFNDHYINSEFLQNTIIDALHTVGVHSNWNQFRQYPLCIVYQLWQPEIFNKLLLEIVNDWQK